MVEGEAVSYIKENEFQNFLFWMDGPFGHATFFNHKNGT